MKWFVEFEEIVERREGLDYYTIFTITFTFHKYVAGPDKWLVSEEKVREWIRVFYGKDFKEKDEEREWWEIYLDKLEKIDKNKWKVTIIRPYTD